MIEVAYSAGMIKLWYLIILAIGYFVTYTLFNLTALTVCNWLDKKDDVLVKEMWADGHKDFYSTFRAKFHCFINLCFIILYILMPVAALITGLYIIIK